ncbi:uncharacterized protein LOC100823970 [Brachypodium distachyon]|uniref:Uncharacterized protein n=1 Tax=Brachypodium distachyon TaxID=15368 RepID=A0A0Q3JH25_BRADI|nr:uncharacterized protein LOC100823970 [Brachypodium distachyon]KQK11668.1 hypothetical protein BRADI_2g61528v3 [Brachypodium distachyon]|eukprot:XP_003565125.2 uncharacterized protein LOC100823970 [Brachypodium distachyon]
MALRFAASKISSGGRALERLPIRIIGDNGGGSSVIRRFSSSQSPSNPVASNVCTQCGAPKSMPNNAAEPTIASSPHLGQSPSVPWWSGHNPRFVLGVLQTIGLAVGGGATIYLEAKYTYKGPIFGNQQPQEEPKKTNDYN